MAPNLFYLALLSPCIAFTIPPLYNNSTTLQLGEGAVVPSHHSEKASVHARVDTGQSVWNPDHEPPYEIRASGEELSKSQILRGLGPAEADEHRYFDWDETCIDPEERRVILAAWRNFQPLVDSATTRLEDLITRLPVKVPAGTTRAANVRYIKQTDPAYTQIFAAQDNRLDEVVKIYKTITTGIQSSPARNGVSPSRLRFMCDKHAQIKDGSGNAICAGGDQSQAQTFIAQGDERRFLEGKFRLTTSDMIVFCPPFFDDEKFPLLPDLPGYKTQPPTFTLDQVDCKERIMLHEYLHLDWSGKMHPDEDMDDTGWLKISKEAASSLQWPEFRKKPDAWAWYALYSFFNNLDGDCKDIWPKCTPRPTKRT
ncbi:hypothetical protein LTR95_012552 [Oleoguttula sp. CCFEE 5521]